MAYDYSAQNYAIDSEFKKSKDIKARNASQIKVQKHFTYSSCDIMASITYMGGALSMGANKFLFEHNGSESFNDFGLNLDLQGRHFMHPSSAKPYQALKEMMAFGLLPGDNYPGFPEENYRPDYLIRIGRKPSEEPDRKPVVLTHAHVDHAGAIHYLRPDKEIRMTRYCEKMLYSMQVTGGAPNSEFINFKYSFGRTMKPRGTGYKWMQGDEVSIPRNIKHIRPFVPFNLGDTEYTAYPVDHSIEGVAYRIRMGGIKVGNTGDFRLSGRRRKDTEYYLDEMAKEKLDALLIEGALVWKKSSGTEDDVALRMTEFIKNVKGLVIVFIAPRDLDRLKSVCIAGDYVGRQIDIDWRMAYRCDLFDEGKDKDEYTKDFGFPKTTDKNIGIYIARKGKGILDDDDYPEEEQDKDYYDIVRHYIHSKKRIKRHEIMRHPHEHIIVMPESNLTDLFDINPPPGSCVVVSHAEPYTEEMVLGEKIEIENLKVLNLLMDVKNKDLLMMDRDFRLPTDHITGHNNFEHTKYVIHKVNPRFVIPVHCTRTDLFYKMDFPPERILVPKQDDIHIFC